MLFASLFVACFVAFTNGDLNCPKSFTNTEALVTFLRGQRRILLNGCAGIELKNALEIEIKNREVPTLNNGAFRNISTLEKIVVDNCEVVHMERGLILDLPNLKTFVLTRNKFHMVREWTFANLDIQHIDLSENQLQNIQRNAFLNTKHLKTAKFNNNYLSHYYASWFEESRESIELIDMSYNRLNYIPRWAFRDFKKLTVLILNNNRIKSVHPDAFVGLTRMQTLDLSHNYIQELYRYTTAPFSQTKIDIRLNNNRLNYLVEETMSHIKFGKVALYANPWKCACYTKILQWASEYQNNVVLRSTCKGHSQFPVCIEQERFPKKCTQQKDLNITEMFYHSYNKVPCT